MKIIYALSFVSAVLLAGGCAHESQQAQYDENLVPNSSAQTSASGSGATRTAVSGPAAVNTASVDATTSAADSRSESDNTLVSSVRELLQRDAEVAPIVPNIQVTANNGAILLNGWVQSQEQKNQIGAICQQAPGVMAVNNQLQALPTPAPQPPTTVENPPGSPTLNPTSSNSNSPPNVYKNTESGSNAPLNQTSAPSSPNRFYQPGSQDHNGQVPDTNNTAR